MPGSLPAVPLLPGTQCPTRAALLLAIASTSTAPPPTTPTTQLLHSTPTAPTSDLCPPLPTCPQTPGGEVVINGEVQPRDTLKLRLYSTSNNVKSTGQGNFWLTGVQPLIKMHQDVKVISVEMTPARELRIVLTSQGLWHK